MAVVVAVAVIVMLVAAIIGGDVKARGYEIPKLTKAQRAGLVILAAAVLVGYKRADLWSFVHPQRGSGQAAAPNTTQSAPHPAQAPAVAANKEDVRTQPAKTAKPARRRKTQVDVPKDQVVLPAPTQVASPVPSQTRSQSDKLGLVLVQLTLKHASDDGVVQISSAN